MSEPPVHKDQVLRAERAFSVEDVRQFMELTGDAGIHHLQPDERGRVMVHGLLTASVPTRLGGTIHYVAREMVFEFLRPVFTGETVTALLRITDVTDEPDRYAIRMEVEVTNESGKPVLTGRSRGVIVKR